MLVLLYLIIIVFAATGFSGLVVNEWMIFHNTQIVIILALAEFCVISEIVMEIIHRIDKNCVDK